MFKCNHTQCHEYAEDITYGLLVECLWFFHAIFAKCSGFVPASIQQPITAIDAPTTAMVNCQSHNQSRTTQTGLDTQHSEDNCCLNCLQVVACHSSK